MLNFVLNLYVQHFITYHDFLSGSNWLMNMYILIKGQGFEWHMYFLTNQLDYSGLFD
jgi:hypothetical protein